ncbi:hypothetical protein ACFFJI_04905 [Allobacillus sp. GCM10007491]|uniref:Ribosomal protein L7/L12 C-terminal domain-containing protein n=2 Tax=Allobacillus TaxID=1400133 RepID=A0A941CUA7_9BACI|nr:MULTISPECIES: hypothetical protein [Allobacillus]MBR7554087.1 hypothetical protein [Allobacillus saliphilus]MBU6079736.1 hypothetical protein [Allobacillus halotolerans]TSJ68013.1 hypothetical protein FPQ10_05540 [Allobacillus sp. SKP2-8]
MQWSEISSILIMLLLLGWGISLMSQNSALKKENLRLLKKTGEYDDMKNEAKEILKSSTEVKTVKSLREKYGLSLIDAKKIVDSVK